MSFFWDREVAKRVERLQLSFNRHGLDRYGVGKREVTIFLSMLAWMYRNYFHVRARGIEHVPKVGRAMLVGNHSGGVALDAGMVIASTLLEMEPPRLAQGMAEKFINLMPFASEWSSRCGQFTGLPEHAARLLEDERLLMVFPEGARGTAKLYWERNSLVGFGTGFMRLSLATRTPIVPFAFLGGGDAIPTIANLYKLGRLVGAPYIPVTPWLVALPRPVPLEVYYGEPMIFDGSATDEDNVIEKKVEQVKERIAALIEIGRAARQERQERRE